MSREPKELKILPVGVASRLLNHCFQKDNGCWVWTGCINRGYGQIKVGGRRGKTLWVHRVSYACFVGVVPEGMSVNHRCHNTRCINPRHLELMTPEENAEDGNVCAEERISF